MSLILTMVAILVVVLAGGVAWLFRPSKVDVTRSNVPPSRTAPAQPPAGLGAGSHAYSIESGGIARTYRVYQPAGLTGAVPLVIMLHGGGGSGANAERYYGWDQQANISKFIVAYPDGLGPNVPAWNVDGGDCCGYPARRQIDDVRFIEDMVTTIESQADIDKARIYAAGISNGGIMAYTLACETSLFAAIGPDSATQLDACDHRSPTSVIHIHGLEDTTIPFDGGQGGGSAKIDGPPVSEVIAGWRKTDDCSPPSSSTTGVVTTQISSCAHGRAVELVTIADGGHGWPGSPPKATHASYGGNAPSQALNATSVMWKFFSQHPK